MSRIDTLREQLGGPHPLAANKVVDHLTAHVRGFIEHAPFAVMATANADGDCDASPRGGQPGWVKVLDDRTLLIPDIGGNRLFQSFQNLESNPRAGFIFMIPGTAVTARVNGRTEVLEGDELQARGLVPELAWSDANSRITQGILLHVDEAYLHCPRSAQFADLWNTDVIEANRKRSLKDLMTD